MAWVTTLGPDMQQVEYRLSAQCGCDHEHDQQVDYRLDTERDLEWIGNGLRDVGLVPGEAVDKEAARALMSGRDPRTGEQLVRPKMALHPKSKVPARPLTEAITQAATNRGTDTATLLGEEKARERFDRMVRGIRRDGEAHRLPLKDAAWLAQSSGIDLEAVYDRRTLAEADEHDGQRVRVGNRGYDLTLDLPKSFSALYGVADPELAAALEETFLQAARETIGAVEDWVGYAMTGHHGNGQSAERIETSGVLGWMTVHRSARPVDGQPGDPHLHVHVALANMLHAADGTWRTVAAGGRDLHRHAHAADAAVKARLRELTAARFGMRWERDTATGAWEVAGVDEGLRAEFSRRSAQVAEHATDGASTAEQKLLARQLAEGKQTDTPAADVRASWRQRAEDIVPDVDAMVTGAAPGPSGPGGGLGIDGPDDGPRMPDPGQIAAHVWRDEDGLCAHRKVVTRADVLAAVMDACPEGIRDIAQAQALTDAVLAVDGHAVRLPDTGGAHMTHTERYTHVSIAAAENVITEQASARLAEGAAQLTAQAAEMTLETHETRSGFTFSAEQRAVIERLLAAGHGTDWVIGGPGTGKTTLMDAARSGWEAAGMRVAGASTAAVAAANLTMEAGIPARTIAAWTREVTGGKGLAGVDVLIVDEGAMVDDRAWAVLLEHAAEVGTKIVGIGDPLQLKAIGVGGGFQRAHEIVDGPVLRENRRQRDIVERAALDVWRDGGRATALAQLAEHGHVHAVENATDALSAMVAAWDADRVRWDGDPHGQIDGLLMLAARNDDVAVLNAGSRAARQTRGELGADYSFVLPGGETLQLAAGDIVRVRRNDYRTRRGGDVDVLNGYRGLVTHASSRGVWVEWRRAAADDAARIEGAWISSEQIAAGALSHGYAMTAAAAQGLTTDRALVYGIGADAHTLYSAITRDREATHLWLPLEAVESEETRRSLGEARDAVEQLHRAVAAYARQLETDRPDGMVTDELEEVGALSAEPQSVHVPDRAAESPQQPRQRRGGAEPDGGSWRQRPYGAVPTPHLESRVQRHLAHADRADQLAEAAEHQAGTVTAELAASPTPGEVFAEGVAAVLAEAEQHVSRAEQETVQEEQARDKAQYARKVQETIQRSTSKSRIALRLAGTSRREQHELLETYSEQIDTGDQEAQRARTAAQQARTRAWQTITSSPYAAVLQQHSTTPTGEAPRDDDALRHQLEAMRGGIKGLADRVDAQRIEDARWHGRTAEGHRSDASRHRVAAAAIQAEQQIREALSPQQRSRETQERLAAQKPHAEQQRQVSEPQAHRRPESPAYGEPGVSR